MDFMDIAKELVAGCREGRERANVDTLYAEDAVSVEPADQGGGRETHGRAAIHGKHEWWEANFETHEVKATGPMPHGTDRFAVIFEMDATEKASGNRFQMQEVAVYTVDDGKITREEFFYGGEG